MRVTFSHGLHLWAMRRLFVLAVLVSTVASPGRAWAQDTLPLPDAIRAALAANPRVRAAEAAADGAEAENAAARAAFFPQVSFVESWQRSNQPVFGFSSLLAARRFTSADFAVDRLNAPGAVSAFASRLFVRQVLFDGRTRAESAQAGHRRDAARAGAAAARAEVVLQVTEAYGRLLGALAAERAATSAADAADENLARAERRRDAGTVTEADVLALSVHLAAMRQQVIRASGEAAIARAQVNALMNTPVTRRFDVVEPGLPETLPQDLEALLRDAEAGRPELRRSDAERLAAEDAARAARAGWLPRVSAQAGWQFEGLSVADRANSWLVAGELTWSLSLGGAEQARADAANAAVRVATASADAARAAVHVEVVTAVERLATARARALAGLAAVDEATERQRIIQNRYDAGLAGVVDVLDAASARLAADADRTAAVVDALVANALLTRAIGAPFPPSLP
jgi:outer membrane protein TolC